MDFDWEATLRHSRHLTVSDQTPWPDDSLPPETQGYWFGVIRALAIKVNVFVGLAVDVHLEGSGVHIAHVVQSACSWRYRRSDQSFIGVDKWSQCFFSFRRNLRCAQCAQNRLSRRDIRDHQIVDHRGRTRHRRGQLSRVTARGRFARVLYVCVFAARLKTLLRIEQIEANIEAELSFSFIVDLIPVRLKFFVAKSRCNAEQPGIRTYTGPLSEPFRSAEISPFEWSVVCLSHSRVHVV